MVVLLEHTLSLSDKVRVQPFLCSCLVSHSEILSPEYHRQQKEKTKNNFFVFTAESDLASFRKAF